MLLSDLCVLSISPCLVSPQLDSSALQIVILQLELLMETSEKMIQDGPSSNTQPAHLLVVTKWECS